MSESDVTIKSLRSEVERLTRTTMEYSRAMQFAVSIAFDAFRIATFKQPKHHDLETIIRWLRHVHSRSS